MFNDRKMKVELRVTIRIYKLLAWVFVIIYIPYIIYDDFVLLRKVDSFGKAAAVFLLQLVYMMILLVGFSFYYWLLALIILYVRKWNRPNIS